MAKTYNFKDLNQARTSIKLNQLIKRERLKFERGFRLGTGDCEIDVVEFEGHSGCYVVDNADARYSELSISDTIDLLNTDDLILSEIR
jgi:hypothetical protein